MRDSPPKGSFANPPNTYAERKSNMKTQLMKLFFSTLAMLALVVGGATRAKAQDPLPSWNDGPAKQAIVEFVSKTTTVVRRISSRQRNALPPSTRTARCGLSTRSTAN